MSSFDSPFLSSDHHFWVKCFWRVKADSPLHPQISLTCMPALFHTLLIPLTDTHEYLCLRNQECLFKSQVGYHSLFTFFIINSKCNFTFVSSVSFTFTQITLLYLSNSAIQYSSSTPVSLCSTVIFSTSKVHGFDTIFSFLFLSMLELQFKVCSQKQ